MGSNIKWIRDVIRFRIAVQSTITNCQNLKPTPTSLWAPRSWHPLGGWNDDGGKRWARIRSTLPT